MSWEKVKLGDISDSIQTGPFGSQLHQSDYSEVGIPVVMPKDLQDGRIVENSIARVEESHVERLSRYKIKEGDILYSRRGDVGRCAFAYRKQNGWLCGTGCLCVTIDDNKADAKFVFYQLQLAEIIGWVKNHAVGSTMLNLNTSILENVPIKLPKLNMQYRIVRILSTYDDLIENNKKQIKLLEEMAQRLYKEWFVDLHFPGYEGVEIVDGVPKGWSNAQLDMLGKFRRGKTITRADIVDGDVAVVAGGIEPAYYNNVSNTEAPVITISASGANAGFVRMYYKRVWASDCSYVDKNHTNHIYYLYCFLKYNKVRIDNLQKGAAQPHVYAKDINALEMLVPSSDLLISFDSVIEPIFTKIKSCDEIIERNIQMRDKLLPYLMTGKLEV